MRRFKKYFSVCLIAAAVLGVSSQRATAATSYDITEFSGGNVSNTAIIQRADAFVTGDTLNIINDITSTANIGNIGNLTLTIDGNGNTLNGTNGATSYSGFTTDAPSNYTFNGITIDGFKNSPTPAAMISGYGSAFYGNAWSGSSNLTINNSSINNNSIVATTALVASTSAYVYGGAISGYNSSAGSLSITGTGSDTFTNNSIQSLARTTTGSANSSGYGGAVYSFLGTASSTISGVNFNQNYVQANAETVSGSAYSYVQAGAVYSYVSNGSSTISDTSFVGNHASASSTKGSFSSSTAYGGAIYSSVANGLFTLSGANFTGNYVSAVTTNATSVSSTGYAGALYNYTNTGATNISGTGFNGNYVESLASGVSSASSTGYGGVIYSNGSLTISGTGSGTFVNNYIEATAQGSSGSSSASANGGTIYSSMSNANLSITSTGSDIFTNNYIQATATNTSGSSSASGSGGFLYNNVSIGNSDISGIIFDKNFISVSATGHTGASASANGGVIYSTVNGGDLDIYDVSFNENYIALTATTTNSSAQTNASGGAIYNSTNNGNLSIMGIGSDSVTKNYIQSSSLSTANSANASANGGAIYTSIGGLGGFTISDISFIENHGLASASGASSQANTNGGAINNYMNNGPFSVTSVSSDAFTNNYLESISVGSSGAAYSTAYGGAIYSSISTGDATISGMSFNGDYAKASSTSPDADATAYGGALYNSISNGNLSLIGTGSNTFTGNYAQAISESSAGSADSDARAGAIYSYIGTGDATISGMSFNGNYVLASANAEARAESYAYGGAIYNSLSDGNLSITNTGSGTFINNYAQSISNSLSNQAISEVQGGAIYNYISTGDATISGMSFNGNYITASATAETAIQTKALGGAIYNYIGSGNLLITSTGSNTFTNNYIQSVAESSSSAPFSDAKGGAIYNEISTGDTTISGISFNENHVTSTAIVTGTTGPYDCVFADVRGGAIYNKIGIGNLSITSTGSDTFTNNYVQSISEAPSANNWPSTHGGALHNDIYQGDAAISGISFNGNYVTNTAIGMTYTFAEAYGGAISSRIYQGNLSITGTGSDTFTNNHVQAIAQDLSDTGTASALGGALFNNVVIGDATISGMSFNGNYTTASATAATDAVSRAHGGAIYNYMGNGSLTIANSTFNNNYVDATASGSTTTIEALGGAIYNGQGALTIKNSTFQNNSARGVGGLGGAIYNQGPVLNIIADNAVTSFSGNTDRTGSNAIYIDNLNGPTTMNLNAGNGGAIVFNDKIAASDNTTIININKAHDDADTTTAPTGAPTGGNVYFNQSVAPSAVNIYNGTVSLGNDNNLNGSDVAFYGGGLNLINGTAGIANFNNLTLNSTVNLGIDVNLNTKSADQITSANPVTVTNGGNFYINNVAVTGDTEKSTSILIADSNTRNAVDLGVSNVTSAIFKYELTYDRTSGNLSVNNTHQFTPGIVSAPVAALLGSYSTQTATYNEVFNHVDMLMFMPRYERLLYETRNKTAMVGNQVFSPTMLPENGKGLWMKQYTAFENVPLSNGPNVSSVTYGSLVGGDTELVNIGHGFRGYLTPYVGYTGSHQNYNNVGVYQNGGLLGLTGTAYKGDFFASLTANSGASNGNTNTGTGTDNFTTLLAGTALKTGYNFEFLQGKFIVQPNFTVSYTFANTFDYTNSAGVEMTADPLNAVQIMPGVKLIGNLKEGWQPYLGLNMIWNFMDSQKFYANNIQLPMMSVAPFVEYGVGLQRKWKERFTGFGQAMARGGGRNGIALQFGFRWAL